MSKKTKNSLKNKKKSKKRLAKTALIRYNLIRVTAQMCEVADTPG